MGAFFNPTAYAGYTFTTRHVVYRVHSCMYAQLCAGLSERFTIEKNMSARVLL